MEIRVIAPLTRMLVVTISHTSDPGTTPTKAMSTNTRVSVGIDTELEASTRPHRRRSPKRWAHTRYTSVSISSETISARIEANTIRHTGANTAPNWSVCGPTPGTAGILSTSQNSPAIARLTTAAATISVRATCTPATRCTRSRRV